MTEHGYHLKVQAGESADAVFTHHVVARQWVQAGGYKAGDAAPQKRIFGSMAFTPGRLRQVLVMVAGFDAEACKTLQTVHLQRPT